jgi:hypothetical protein
MIQESGIYNCFTQNHIPVSFFNKPTTVGSFDVDPRHSPYACLLASDLTGDKIPMPSYVLDVSGEVTREFKREIDFLNSLGLCAVEETASGSKYHIHVFAELFYGPNKLFRLYTRSLSTTTAAPIFEDLRQLMYRYVLPGKYLSYKGQVSEEPVELTYIKAAIADLAVQLK